MNEFTPPACPVCENPEESLDRRGFLRNVATQAASVAVVGSLTPVATRGLTAQEVAPPPVKVVRPAEALVRELYTTLTPEQRRNLVLPYDHGAGANGQRPTRQGIYNSPIQGKKIGDNYTQAQQELISRILRSMVSDEEGLRRLSRNGTYDSSGSFAGNGATIFGDPGTEGRPFAFVFAGHHLTLRCDGDSEANTAFGGPIYYGHSVDGNSPRNVYNYQTQAVKSVFESLSEAQRRVAVITGSPGEGVNSVRLRRDMHPGLSSGELNADQRHLVEGVMRNILSPYRRQDVDEVMDIIRRSGGMDRIHLAFYRDRGATDNTNWHFWRLEGPGFVWNYRILPHVHTFVNIAIQA